MDESHRIAPTVRGNTADLPAALASIIGIAGVETRVVHEDLGWLGTWLQDRCRRGFDLPEVFWAAAAALSPSAVRARVLVVYTT